MRIPNIKGYVNDDKELWFNASISTTKNFEDKFSRSGELGKLIKEKRQSCLSLTLHGLSLIAIGATPESTFLTVVNGILKIYREKQVL